MSEEEKKNPSKIGSPDKPSGESVTAGLMAEKLRAALKK